MIMAWRLLTEFPLKTSIYAFMGSRFKYNLNVVSQYTCQIRKVRARSNTLSLFSYQSSMHRSLYYEKQRGLSLIAFDGNNSESEGEDGHHGLDSVMKLYSAFKNKKIHELSADERRRVSNFLSFFETFQGRTVSFPPCLGRLNFPFLRIKFIVWIRIFKQFK